ncbi:MAG: UDP-N-acetylglucosamine 1-carboxyvinyltransferase [Firmicutes bacterium]|nr:UDP-N-acetylglucosamine 1-carboxyvinyltransferase [Bacillota bacterium]
MEKFIITGGNELRGEVRISGSKNAALPLLAASLLTDEECILHSVPLLSDVCAMLDIIGSLGRKTIISGESVHILPGSSRSVSPDPELSRRFRASFLVCGALLAKKGRARAVLPGGCAIGSRPVDLHLKGFCAMGAKTRFVNGHIELKAKELAGERIYLDFPSVGATENILIAATLAKGLTTIENAATEPEIEDLCIFLNKMGARISGIGTATLTVEGVPALSGAEHTIIPDRIEAGTFMAAAIITHGDILLRNVRKEHLLPVIAKLKEARADITEEAEGLRIRCEGAIAPISLKTMPFPGFPTDMQAPLMSLLCIASGTSVITETIFENRFMQAAELNRMGANIRIESPNAIIEGTKQLTGAAVRATDLRAGAALVLSALAAKGDTEISDIYHIERGYFELEKKLLELGADIKKVDV